MKSSTSEPSEAKLSGVEPGEAKTNKIRKKGGKRGRKKGRKQKEKARRNAERKEENSKESGEEECRNKKAEEKKGNSVREEFPVATVINRKEK